MTVFELIWKRRTIRRFRQEKIPVDLLTAIVDTGRIAPSASNLQPLEFIMVDDEDLLPQIFVNTRWAGYLPNDEGRPPKGQEPTAFIVILVNIDIAGNWAGHDVGAAGENMILAALSEGIGSCWIASVNAKAVSRILKIPQNYRIDSVIAMGYPNEQPVSEPMRDSIEYYKDESGVLHVPKRQLDDILHHNQF
ncbi:MAG: nitroreductase [Calditrichaeota bacterium]|nr:nitroreductase [Calditrichota bacterium]